MGCVLLEGWFGEAEDTALSCRILVGQCTAMSQYMQALSGGFATERIHLSCCCLQVTLEPGALSWVLPSSSTWHTCTGLDSMTC